MEPTRYLKFDLSYDPAARNRHLSLALQPATLQLRHPPPSPILCTPPYDIVSYIIIRTTLLLYCPVELINA